MTKIDNYSDLKKTFDYDKKKAARLAEAVTEAIEVKKRLDYLTKLINDNQDLQPFLWTTLDGRTKAIHDLEDSHVENIIKHVTRMGGEVSEPLRAEAESRNIDVIALTRTEARLLRHSIDDDNNFDGMEWGE